MGWKLYREDLVKLNPNQEKDLIICLQPENRAAIHGIVKFPDCTPVKGAVVKLFKKEQCAGECNLVPITFTFTDRCGQFLFGVDSCVEYVIKVFFYTPEEPCPICAPIKRDCTKTSCNYYEDVDC